MGGGSSTQQEQPAAVVKAQFESQQAPPKPIIPPLNDIALEAIRLIKFDDFIKLKTFPRYPENKDIVRPLKQVQQEDADFADHLIVFVSHCWLRGWHGAAGWDGKPHPDDAKGSKYQLCVEGIKKVLKNLAPGMKSAYLWLDFACIDQDGNPAGELKLLDKIVQVCDLIFTPVVDPDPKSWALPSLTQDAYEDFKISGWVGQPHSYLNRGWCRVEMFYAANIPFVTMSEEEHAQRMSKLHAGLKFHRSDGRRPHILFTNYHIVNLMAPTILPPLQNSWFEKYNPGKGFLTKQSDLTVINRLVEELKPYMTFQKESYEGTRNSQGEYHGYGVLRYENGDIYAGGWKNGKKDGMGKMIFSFGDIYEGGYKDNVRHGKGRYIFANSNVFEGMYKDGKKEGPGVFQYANGDIFNGNFKNNYRHGQGHYTYFEDKEEYEGEYGEDQRHGKGVYRFANGDVYEGSYVKGNKSGYGVMKYADGSRYEGEFASNVRNGTGKLIAADGKVTQGIWKGDKLQ